MHLFVISVTLLCNANLIKGENLGSACLYWKKPPARSPFQRWRVADPALEREVRVSADYFNKSSGLNSFKADANVILLWGEKHCKRQQSSNEVLSSVYPKLNYTQSLCRADNCAFMNAGRFFPFFFGKKSFKRSCAHAQEVPLLWTGSEQARLVAELAMRKRKCWWITCLLFTFPSHLKIASSQIQQQRLHRFSN